MCKFHFIVCVIDNHQFSIPPRQATNRPMVQDLEEAIGDLCCLVLLECAVGL